MQWVFACLPCVMTSCLADGRVISWTHFISEVALHIESIHLGQIVVSVVVRFGAVFVWFSFRLRSASSEDCVFRSYS